MEVFSSNNTMYPLLFWQGFFTIQLWRLGKENLQFLVPFIDTFIESVPCTGHILQRHIMVVVTAHEIYIYIYIYILHEKILMTCEEVHLFFHKI